MRNANVLHMNRRFLLSYQYRFCKCDNESNRWFYYENDIENSHQWLVVAWNIEQIICIDWKYFDETLRCCLVSQLVAFLVVFEALVDVSFLVVFADRLEILQSSYNWIEFDQEAQRIDLRESNSWRLRLEKSDRFVCENAWYLQVFLRSFCNLIG